MRLGSQMHTLTKRKLTKRTSTWFRFRRAIEHKAATTDAQSAGQKACTLQLKLVIQRPAFGKNSCCPSSL